MDTNYTRVYGLVLNEWYQAPNTSKKNFHWLNECIDVSHYYVQYIATL